MYDLDLIYSWTPREYKNFIKGAKLREIDEIELSIVSAVISGRAYHNPKVQTKKFFDANKARKEILKESVNDKQYDLTRYRKAMEALRKHNFTGRPKPKE